MAELLPHFKQKIDNMVLVPSDKGRFEFSINGDLVYSKLETGEFPEPADIIDLVEKHLVS
ncbi:MAG: SelT/SelW/SelH family protein [Candidatus Eisenbacteria bacterium]|uniref:SelT/SelW/SelH family protein n=1 Tax=Eiseniibacteriota bacterium TaxID=2212470 RepID=A0A7Y2H1Q9_UNCEI|nr:SelT/SelW/SelH family protein [Candidatus Eisenbacteria bacterium]